MATDERVLVEREIYIDAVPETVFGFFTDPERMVLWKGMTASLDPRPGGEYRCRISPSDLVIGEFREVTPYSRIVFTWGFESGPVLPGSTTVEVTLTPDGNGTRLRLVHRDIPREATDDHAGGWDHFLPRLAIVAAGGDPGADPWAAPDAMGTA